MYQACYLSAFFVLLPWKQQLWQPYLALAGLRVGGGNVLIVLPRSLIPWKHNIRGRNLFFLLSNGDRPLSNRGGGYDGDGGMLPPESFWKSRGFPSIWCILGMEFMN